MNIGVIGYRGTVGSSLIKLGYEAIECDVTSPEDVRYSIASENWDAIIYAAGVTDVEKCEVDYKSAMKVNAWGINNLVDVYSGKVIYISTDHIFSGKKFLMLGYSEGHCPNPVNNYGRTKLGGELVSTSGLADTRIIRTSKLFDKRYVNKSFDVWKNKVPIEFSNVLKRSFLHVNHFVDGIQFVLDNWEKIPTILNISGTAIMSHYMFFHAVARHLDIDPTLIVARNYYDKTLAPRPRRCGLNVSLAKSLGVPLYSAYDGIKLL